MWTREDVKEQGWGAFKEEKRGQEEEKGGQKSDGEFNVIKVCYVYIQYCYKETHYSV